MIIKLFLNLKSGIEWKGKNIRAEDEMSSRKKITEENFNEFSDDIMNRSWF